MSKIKKLASGVGWGAVSTIAITGFQLVFMGVMARLLDPVDFGLVAIANVSLRFFSYFAQLGTAPALIQKPQLEDGDVAAALAVSLGISSFFLGITQIAAPFFESFYQMSGLGLVIQVLSVNFVIGGFSVISSGLLRRNTAFRAIAIIDLVSYLIGYGFVGLTCAYYGLEVWALVAAVMTQMTMTAFLGYLVVRYPLSFRHSKAQRQHFFSYGGRYSIIGFIEFLSFNLDAMVVGKLLGAAPAGFYNRALLLANLPVQQPSYILTKTLFPIMSSISDQHDKQSISFQLSTLLVGSYAFAVSMGIFVAAPDIIKVLLGNKWLEAIPILKVLVWSVGPIYITHVAGVTLDSMNKLKTKLRIQLSMLVLLVSLVLLVAPSGKVLDIAMAVVLTEWVRLIIMTIKMGRLLSVSIRDRLLIMSCILIISMSSGLSIYLVMDLVPLYLSSVVRVCIEIILGALGLLLGMLVIRYVAVRLDAIRFLANRSPRFAKLLPKFA